MQTPVQNENPIGRIKTGTTFSSFKACPKKRVPREDFKTNLFRCRFLKNKLIAHNISG